MIENPIPKTEILKRLWVGTCTIYEYQKITNGKTFQTSYELVPMIENKPCRLSYKTESITDLENGVAQVIQKIVLFLSSEIEVPAGCLIEVTQHGKTNQYRRSSEVSLFTNHQEIVLEIDKDV